MYLFSHTEAGGRTPVAVRSRTSPCHRSPYPLPAGGPKGLWRNMRSLASQTMRRESFFNDLGPGQTPRSASLVPGRQARQAPQRRTSAANTAGLVACGYASRSSQGTSTGEPWLPREPVVSPWPCRSTPLPWSADTEVREASSVYTSVLWHLSVLAGADSSSPARSRALPQPQPVGCGPRKACPGIH